MRDDGVLRTMIVDDEPLAIERMQVLCAEIEPLQVVGTASDGEALRIGRTYLRKVKAMAGR